MLVVNNHKWLNKYFQASEFFTEPVMGAEISGDLIQKLYDLRVAVKRQININSGYRSEDYNALVGGVKNSRHIIGEAVDLAYNGKSYRNSVILHALNVGFTGIGIAKNFIHLDVRSGDRVVWTYSNK